MRRGALLICAAVIATAAIIHLSLKPLDKPFDDEPDWDNPFEPATPFAATAPAAAFHDGSGGLVEQDGWQSLHPPLWYIADAVAKGLAPPVWITAANADEDRFNRAVNRLSTSFHSTPLTTEG